MAYTTPRTWTTGETPTATIMNTHVRDNLSYLYAPDDAWTTLAQTGWTSPPSGYRALAYRIVGGTRVQLRGALQKDSGTLTANTGFNFPSALPSGYRPGQSRAYIIATNDVWVARLVINTSGVMQVVTTGSATSWVCWEGIEFDTAN